MNAPCLRDYMQAEGLTKPPPCFYCGETISEDGVFWMGHGQAQLYLHEQCCLNLVVRLFRDVHELQISRGGKKCH